MYEIVLTRTAQNDYQKLAKNVVRRVNQCLDSLRENPFQYPQAIPFVDNNGQAKPISTQAIKALFTTLKDNIQAVVLNACYSESQAKAITDIIDCAIGMNAAISDEAAITFTVSFYRAVGFGRSIQESFDQGTTALLLEGISEELTPELLTKSGVNPASIVLAESNSDSRQSVGVLNIWSTKVK